MDMPQASRRNERLGVSVRTLLELLRFSGEPAAATRVRDLPPQVWDETISLALRHGVGPLLQRALQLSGALTQVPGHVRTRLEEERRATALDNLRNYGEFRRVARALRERGIPVIALKGLQLAELVYRDISLRPMSDLDILVPVARVKHAVDVLLTLDYALDNNKSGGYDIKLTHLRLGILVEVHWTLGTPTENYTPPIEDIWRDAEPALLGDTEAQVMSPEFLLLYVCAHVACHHLFAFDLRALCDITEIVHAYPGLDWAAVVDRSRRHGWGRGVAAALRLARDHLGAAVPENALAAIGGDKLDPERLNDALEQLTTFVGFSFELRFAPNLMALTSTASAREKIATLWKRIFVPRAELALIYGVPEHSARINLYYAVRLRDLVRRYAASVRELKLSGEELAATTARNARLARWINGR